MSDDKADDLIGNITFPAGADMRLTPQAFSALAFLGVTMALEIDRVMDLGLVSGSFEIIMHGFNTTPRAEHNPDDHRLKWEDFKDQFERNIKTKYEKGWVRRCFALCLSCFLLTS